MSERRRTQRGHSLNSHAIPTRPRFRRLGVEQLEPRRVLSTNVTTYLQDLAQTGANTTETVLTPLNVNSTTFGLRTHVALDGMVTATPLYMAGVNISAGAHQGLHNVAYVATEHDSLYAIDADTGVILWQDSFISNFSLGVTRVNPNLSGSVAVSAVPNADTNSPDIAPELGVVATPVIDPATGTIYVTANTKEVINGATASPHYLWQLYAIDLSSGALKTTIGATSSPGVVTIGETIAVNPGTPATTVFTYLSGPSVAGTGAGNVNGVVWFNALRQMNRPALTLANGSVVIAWASHGDNDPYHHWVFSYSASTLALNGVFNGTPNGTEGGTWQSGGKVDVDAAGALYFETGNGTFAGININFNGNPPPAVLNAAGFPADADYGDSVVKLVYDPTTTTSNPGPNGWGLKVADYFAPWNQQNIDNNDIDMASSGLTLLPDSAGNAQHPHLLIARGKTGVIYLIDRDNMGKYTTTTDHVVEEITNSSGFWSSPTYYNGSFYSTGNGDRAKQYSVANAEFSVNPVSTSTMAFAYPGATGIVTANGAANGILWQYDLGANALRAFDASNLATELYDTGQAPAGRDSLGTVVKFTAPSAADGKVFVNTTNGLNIYGLLSAPTAAPPASTALTSTSTAPGQVQLQWTRGAGNSTNYEDDQEVYRSTDGTNFTLVGIATAGRSTYSDSSGVQSGVIYTYKVRSVNAIGRSAFTGAVGVQALVGISGVWADTDVGAPGAAGNVVFANNALTVSGSGADVWGNSDQFNFVYQPLTGNGTIVAKVVAQGNTSASAKAGVMIRNSLNPTSAYAYAFVTPTAGLKLEGRLTDGAVAGGAGVTVGGAAPYWVKLVRTGSSIAGSISTDGVNFTSVGSLNVTLTNSTVYIGLAVTSQNNGAVSTATFNNVIVGAGNGLPTTPNSLIGNLSSGSQFNMSWTNTATNEDGVKVMRKDPGASAFHQVALLPARTTSFFDGALTNGATYSYQIVASNTVGDSAPSNTIVVAIPTPPDMPTGFQVTSLTATSTTFSWQLSGTANNGVKVFRRDTTTSLYALIATLPANATTFTDSGRPPNSLHDYNIQAFNDGGFSGAASLEVLNATLPPSGVAATGNHASIQVSWIAPVGGATYNIYRGTTPGGEAATPYASGIGDTTFQDSAAVTGLTYYYTVTAQNAFNGGGDADHATLGPSAASSEVSGIFLGPTASITPPNPTVVSSLPPQMQIVFSKPVTGLTLGSLSLAAAGKSNIITGSQTLATSDNITYTLGNLAALTVPGGLYTLKFTTLGSGVKDAANNSVLADASASLTLNPVAPEILGVYVRGGEWQPSVLKYLAANGLGDSTLGYQLVGGANQLKTLPWTDLDTISVLFSQDVNIDTPSIALLDSLGVAPVLSAANYAYNSLTHVARWSFGSPLAADKFLLSVPAAAVSGKASGALLDGEFANAVGQAPGGVLPSGDGAAGGNFSFRFNVLPGDINQTGAVTTAEADAIRPHFLQFATQQGYTPLMDLTGKGRITGLDYSAILANVGHTLPVNDPQAPSGGGAQAAELPVNSLIILAGQTVTLNSDGSMSVTSNGTSGSAAAATSNAPLANAVASSAIVASGADSRANSFTASPSTTSTQCQTSSTLFAPAPVIRASDTPPARVSSSDTASRSARLTLPPVVKAIAPIAIAPASAHRGGSIVGSRSLATIDVAMLDAMLEQFDATPASHASRSSHRRRFSLFR